MNKKETEVKIPSGIGTLQEPFWTLDRPMYHSGAGAMWLRPLNLYANSTADDAQRLLISELRKGQ